ncbi:DUF2612 domain-containing protein [Brevibacillus panacihumi]|uniref:DUF2612 domain-containing protein n=1 Tax=Brevibacillus panacihumi TaxID=497735 RepID=UPI003D1F0C2D
MAIDPYLNLITSQHINKKKYISWVTALLTKVDHAITFAKNLPSHFDIDTATGVQLDVLGEIIGRSRYLPFELQEKPTLRLSDASYRTALKAKIAINQWDGTIPQIYELWNNLFPETVLRIKDNQNMTMVATIYGELNIEEVQLITVGYIIPKPFGVGLTVVFQSPAKRNDYVGMIASGYVTTVIDSEKPY